MWHLKTPHESELSSTRTILFLVLNVIAAILIIMWSLTGSCNFSSTTHDYSCADVRYGNESIVFMSADMTEYHISDTIINKGQKIGPCKDITVSYDNYQRDENSLKSTQFDIIRYTCGKEDKIINYSNMGKADMGQHAVFIGTKVEAFGISKNISNLHKQRYSFLMGQTYVSLMIQDAGIFINSNQPEYTELLQQWYYEYLYLIGNKTLSTTFSCTSCYSTQSSFDTQAFSNLAVRFFSLMTPAFTAIKFIVSYNANNDDESEVDLQKLM